MMDKYIKDKSLRERRLNKGLESQCQRLMDNSAKGMKVIGKKISNKELEFCILKKRGVTQANGLRECKVDKENSSTQMALKAKVYGRNRS
jgi:hypothetical protein